MEIKHPSKISQFNRFMAYLLFFSKGFFVGVLRYIIVRAFHRVLVSLPLCPWLNRVLQLLASIKLYWNVGYLAARYKSAMKFTMLNLLRRA